jgi:hypothetical protein
MISPCCRNPDTSDPQVAHTREDEVRAMRTWSSLLIAAPVALGLLAAPAAHADWHHHGGGWGGGWQGHERHHDRGNGDAVAGALVGLGVGALLGGIIASSQPQYYAPPPVVYAPPPPYGAPAYYSVPTGY